MRTLEINISIPLRDDAVIDEAVVLKKIAEIIGDGLDDIDWDATDMVIADRLGFGGNTLTLTTGDLVEEVCL